jgi:hypothetical protein
MALYANTLVSLTNLNPDGIAQSIKNYIKSKNEFLDYDFEGSVLSQLIDIMAQNTYYDAFLVNMLRKRAIS